MFITFFGPFRMFVARYSHGHLTGIWVFRIVFERARSIVMSFIAGAAKSVLALVPRPV